MDIQALIDKYYPEDNELRRMFLTHSRQVAERALQVAERHPELGLDKILLYEGGMLHDIGIFMTDAPGIHCHGSEPYLLHGTIGAQLLRGEGLPQLARMCERHTGAGLTCEDIRRQHLPLPERDLLPETLEEKVVCYADKFYSKSNLERTKTPEQAFQSLRKFGEEGAQRFLEWDRQFR